MQSLIDTTIEHYRVQRRLARGGMSEIYLAEDTRSSEIVALKIVPQQAEDYAERFRREIRTIASLHHEHILPALDYGEYRSWFYLVTPYIAHGTLREHLGKGPLSLKAAGLFLEQLADALHYAHTRGILHRDIKAPNVLLRDNDYAYLADFGLVKSISDEYSLTRTGFLVGTPEYMAPELVEYSATVQSDIYALGIVLYEMLTGDLPFKGSTPVAIVMKHLREAPVPPSRLNPLIPSALEQVILRALDKSPQQRFENAGELARAYRQALEEEAKTETVHVTALANAPTLPGPASLPAPEEASTLLDPPPVVVNVAHAPIAQNSALPFVEEPRKPDMGNMMPPPFAPAQVSVRPIHHSPMHIRARKQRSPRWMWPVLTVSIVLLLIAVILLVSIFSSLHSSLPSHPQTPVATPANMVIPATTSSQSGMNSTDKPGKRKKHDSGD